MIDRDTLQLMKMVNALVLALHAPALPEECPECGNTLWTGETWCEDCGAVYDEVLDQWFLPPDEDLKELVG